GASGSRRVRLPRPPLPPGRPAASRRPAAPTTRPGPASFLAGASIQPQDSTRSSLLAAAAKATSPHDRRPARPRVDDGGPPPFPDDAQNDNIGGVRSTSGAASSGSRLHAHARLSHSISMTRSLRP